MAVRTRCSPGPRSSGSHASNPIGARDSGGGGRADQADRYRNGVNRHEVGTTSGGELSHGRGGLNAGEPQLGDGHREERLLTAEVVAGRLLPHGFDADDEGAPPER